MVSGSQRSSGKLTIVGKKLLSADYGNNSKLLENMAKVKKYEEIGAK